MTLDEKIDRFLSAPAFAVVGASDEKHKYGHKVFICYRQNNRIAYPVNPNAQTVLGDPCYSSLLELPESVQSASIITPPAVTKQVVQDAIKAGVKYLWMQPGAESRSGIEAAENAGIEVIHGGACLLVVLGYRMQP